MPGGHRPRASFLSRRQSRKVRLGDKIVAARRIALRRCEGRYFQKVRDFRPRKGECLQDCPIECQVTSHEKYRGFGKNRRLKGYDFNRMTEIEAELGGILQRQFAADLDVGNLPLLIRFRNPRNCRPKYQSHPFSPF